MILHTRLMQLYSLLLSMLTGVLLTGHLLGFAGVYTLLPALILMPLCTVAIYRLYYQPQNNWFQALHPQKTIDSALLKRVLIISVLLIMGLVFGWRMITYPFSEFATLIPQDFIGYHAIKAIDLAYYGSVWNLNIPYGQYPVGYESLVAFPLLLTGSLHDTGLVHLVITLLLWLTLYGLLRRYTDFTPALSLAISLACFFVPLIYSQVVVIGKNDILLALSVLMAILHAPVSRTDDRTWHPVGLACATLLSIATKGSGLYVLVFLWGMALFQALRDWHNNQPSLTPGEFVITLLMMFPGGWWVLRNLVIMGQPYSPEVSNFFQTSIVANLSNPALYDVSRGFDNLLLLLAVSVLLIAALLWRNHFSWRMAALLGVLMLNYVATPLSAFDTIERTILNIEWRFQVLPLLMMLVVSLALISPVIMQAYHAVNRHSVRVLAACSLIITGTVGILWLLDAPDFFRFQQRSPFDYPPDSVYSCVDERLQDGTVYLENTNGFYLRYHNPNLRFTAGNAFPLRMPDVYNPPPPDYAVFIRFLPEMTMQFRYLDYLDMPLAWDIICEYDSGTVYRRIPADN